VKSWEMANLIHRVFKKEGWVYRDGVPDKARLVGMIDGLVASLPEEVGGECRCGRFTVRRVREDEEGPSVVRVYLELGELDERAVAGYLPEV
jgi:hypothetical protein